MNPEETPRGLAVGLTALVESTVALFACCGFKGTCALFFKRIAQGVHAEKMPFAQRWHGAAQDVQWLRQRAPFINWQFNAGSMEASHLRFILETIDELPEEGVVMECGSGQSTIFLAQYLQRVRPDCQLIAIEHNPEWADRVRAWLEAEGLSEFAQVRLVHMTEQRVHGHATTSYAPQTFQEGPMVNLLIIDGPPSALHKLARLAVLPNALPIMADGALAALDDAGRKGERVAARVWSHLPGVSFVKRFHSHSGMATFTVRRQG